LTIVIKVDKKLHAEGAGKMMRKVRNEEMIPHLRAGGEGCGMEPILQGKE